MNCLKYLDYFFFVLLYFVMWYLELYVDIKFDGEIVENKTHCLTK